MGFAAAQYHLALALQKDSGSGYRLGASSRNYFEKAAEQGHIRAAMALARSPRSAEDKLRWLTVAAEGGLAEAQYELYRFMLKSAAARYKSRSATDWLQSAAEKGFAEARYELGRILIHGDRRRGIKKNSTAARQWWEKAADNGHGRAMEDLSWRYTRAADGFPRDPDRAVELLNKIAVGYSQGRYGLPQNQRLADARLGIFYFIHRAPARHHDHQFPGSHVRQPALRHTRYQPQQPDTGPDHPGRRVAQQPPSLRRVSPAGILLVGTGHHLHYPGHPLLDGYCAGSQAGV